MLNLKDYLSKDILSKKQIDEISEILQSKKSVLIIGNDNCKVQEITNGIFSYLATKKERLIVIEDHPVFEADNELGNVKYLVSTNRDSIITLLRKVYSENVEIVILREITNEEESYELFKLWNNKCYGIASMKARLASEILDKKVPAKLGLIVNVIRGESGCFINTKNLENKRRKF